MGNWNRMLYCKETHPLLLECAIVVLRYMKWFQELHTTYTNLSWSTSCHFCQYKYQISCKMSDFGRPLSLSLSTGNGILCCKDRHPLVLQWLITFISCIMVARGVSDNMYKLLMVHTVSFLAMIKLKLYAKYQTLSTLSAWEMECWPTMKCVHCCLSVPQPLSNV